MFVGWGTPLICFLKSNSIYQDRKQATAISSLEKGNQARSFFETSWNFLEWRKIVVAASRDISLKKDAIEFKKRRYFGTRCAPCGRLEAHVSILSNATNFHLFWERFASETKSVHNAKAALHFKNLFFFNLKRSLRILWYEVNPWGNTKLVQI